MVAQKPITTGRSLHLGLEVIQEMLPNRKQMRLHHTAHILTCLDLP